MNARSPRRAITMLACASALAGITAGNLPTSVTPSPVSASDGGGIVTVPGTRCPKSHPRRVGSYSSWSTSQVNGGAITRRSVHRVICAR
jgi:hypothetical protein